MEAPHTFLGMASIWIQLGPMLALLARREWAAPPVWIALGAAISLIGDLLGGVAGSDMTARHWFWIAADPLVFSLFLLALGQWQVTELERTAVLIATLVVLVLYAGVVLLHSYSSGSLHLGLPMYASVLLGGATWTLIRRAHTERPSVSMRSNWLWMTAGLALYGLILLVTHPLGIALLTFHRADLFSMVWEFRALGVGLAFAAITVGCALRSTRLDPAR